MKHVNWTALICAVCGISTGWLFAYVYAGDLNEKNKALEENIRLLNNGQYHLINALEQTSNERDVLSDIIRAYKKYQDSGKGNCPIYDVAEEFLPAIERDTTDLGNWSYRY